VVERWIGKPVVERWIGKPVVERWWVGKPVMDRWWVVLARTERWKRKPRTTRAKAYFAPRLSRRSVYASIVSASSSERILDSRARSLPGALIFLKFMGHDDPVFYRVESSKK